MTHGSLFSGIGGFDLAAEWMGWENIFHCEVNKFGRRILKYYWPNSISYEDIIKTDFTRHKGTIDVLSGGFPCQPYSITGERKGNEDDRHLWPQMLRAIREVQPVYIVGENVPGIINWNEGLVFEEVQSDLEAEGYEVQPVILPALSIGLPHRRDRVWFVAYSSSFRHQRVERPFEDTGTLGKRRTGVFGSATQLHHDIDWKERATQSGFLHANDGIPRQLDGIAFSEWRSQSIKGGGNAIAPQIAYQIFNAINSIHRQPTY